MHKPISTWDIQDELVMRNASDGDKSGASSAGMMDEADLMLMIEQMERNSERD